MELYVSFLYFCVDIVRTTEYNKSSGVELEKGGEEC